MSTIYFTNNADSGDGSLRDAITNCAAGDTISPQGFAEGDITILLGSYLPTKSFTLDAGENNRIILDGQGTSDFFRIGLAATETTFNKVTFQNGFRDSSAPFYASAFTSLTFKRCAFLNNSGATGFITTAATSTGSFTFDSCYAFGNTATNTGRAGVLYFPTSSKADATLDGCTFGGTVGGVSDVLDGGQTSLNGSLVENFNGETTDFTSMIDATTGDYRLKPSSEFLRGGWTTGVDYLGNQRSGARGAFSGSYFIVSGSAEISQNTVVDYSEIADNSIITFFGTDVILRFTSSPTLNAVQFVADSNSTGYVAFPQETKTERCSYVGVTECYNGNFITSVTYDEEAIVFESTTPESPVLLEVKNDDKWEVVTNTLVSPYKIVVSKDTEYRLFDGYSFQNVTVVAPASYYEIAEAYTLGYIQ